MGTLLLVRHGQASAFSDDYDKLSPLGEEQARRLGAHWGARGVRIDRAYFGPRQRQRQTAELVCAGLREAGAGAPEPVLLEDLDEMRVEPLLQLHLPGLLEQHVALRGLGEAMFAAESEEQRNLAFRRLGARVLQMWNRGELEVEGVETWADFSARLQRGLDTICNQAGRGVRLAAFSSAGSIGAVAQLALGISNERALDLVFRIRNSSVSEFLFSQGRFSLGTFNELPHLEPGQATII